MGLELTPLERGALSAAVQKALTGPARMMAARGIAPLPTPGELATALYALTFDADPAIADSARATAGSLPDKVLIGVFADPRLDPRVLDWLAGRSHGQPALFDALIRNPAIADQTVASAAARGTPAEVDQIANNEQRLLRHPEIIAAMYTNKHARMSTVDRAVELAVRNQVRVPGLAAWDEIARALDQDGPSGPEADAAFAAAMATELDDSELTMGDPEDVEAGDATEALLERAAREAEEKKGKALNISGQIREATIGNAFDRAKYIRSPIKMVAVAAIKSPGMTEIEATRFAGSSSLHEEVIRHISTRRDWTRLYSIKLALSMNPKTPIPEVQKMLPHLREKDLAKVAKSKGVQSAVVAQARKLIMQRGSGGKR